MDYMILDTVVMIVCIFYDNMQKAKIKNSFYLTGDILLIISGKWLSEC